MKKCARLLAVPFGVGLAALAWVNLATTDAPPPEVHAEMQPVLLSTNLGLNASIQLGNPSQGALLDIHLDLDL